jgi:hypothetical protein
MTRKYQLLILTCVGLQIAAAIQEKGSAYAQGLHAGLVAVYIVVLTMPRSTPTLEIVTVQLIDTFGRLAESDLYWNYVAFGAYALLFLYLETEKYLQ